MDRMLEHFFPDTIPSHIRLNNFKQRTTVFATLACDKTKLPDPFYDQHVDDPATWLASVLHFSLHPKLEELAIGKILHLDPNT